jgi:hypothetical protein
VTLWRRPSPLAAAVAVVAVVLLGTAEDRLLGTVTDEQVIVATSLSIAEFAELGIAKGPIIAVARPGGDAVAPYGIAWPALLAPFMALAGPFERAFGSGTSQALLILLPIGLVIAASAGAGLLARAAGASASGQALAALSTGIGSPLWAYASTLFTEPLQAATLVFALYFAARRRALLAGLMIGIAVLTKSVNIVILPLALMPLMLDRSAGDDAPSRRRLALRAAAGAALPLAAWLTFDVVRFGAPLRGYVGQHFSHPIVDGFWRLLVGLNEGLLVFFPLLALALAGLVTLARRAETRGLAIAIGGTFTTLLLLYSAWWAWDGSSGWGPRLLVPTIPLLAAAAGVAASAARMPRTFGPGLLALGIAVNSLGILQSDVATTFYIDAGGSRIVPEEQVSWYPDGLAASAPPGERRISRSMAVVRDSAFSPLIQHPILLERRFQNDIALPGNDALPWWKTPSMPDILDGEISGNLRAYLGDLRRWPHWGAVLRAAPDERRLRFHGAWQDASLDQILRALDVGRFDRAAWLAREQWEISHEPFAAALLAEALRVGGRRDELGAFLRSLPPPAVATIDMTIVLALVARDMGNEETARAALRAAFGTNSPPALRRAIEAPMEEWPATYRAMLGSGVGAR